MRMMLYEHRKCLEVVHVDSLVHVTPHRVMENGIAQLIPEFLVITEIGDELSGIVIDHDPAEVEHNVSYLAHEVSICHSGRQSKCGRNLVIT